MAASPTAAPPIISRIDPRSEEFRANVEANLRNVETLRGHLEKARAGGGPRYNQRHLDRGKLLPRQRLELLLDRASPFLELCPLAGLHLSGTVPGGALVAGIGRVSGVDCLVTSSEATVQGGAIPPTGVQKSQRLSEVALENKLPVVHCVESAGADLPNQAEIFVPGGAGFRDITRRSALKIPTVSLVFGSCTAGGAYVPGMSDYTVMVKDQAYMYLAGPPLVQMAIGETVDDESLGGATMHSTVSGVSDYLADSEADAIRIGRELISATAGAPPLEPPYPSEAPRYDAAELLGIASADLKRPFEIREIIARIVDGSRFHEFKPRYGSTLVTGFARLHGYPIGILGNNGILYGESADKGAQFIELCNQANIPLLFLQNITGFMVGKAVEERGIIKAGAKLINAVSNSAVPAITLMVGGSYGAGNYAMMGRAYKPRFLFSWPNHKVAVMGPEQLAGVLDIITREGNRKKGLPTDEAALSTMKQMLVGKVEHESTCWSATGRLFDDGVIDPRDTRAVLTLCLSVIHRQAVEGTMTLGTFRH